MRFLVMLACLSLGFVAFADVTIEADQATQHIMRVTYLIVDSTAGHTSFCKTFPEAPLPDKLTVDRVFENNTQQALPYHVFSSNDWSSYNQVYAKLPETWFNHFFEEAAWMVCFNFPNPVPKGGSYTISVTAHSATNWISQDAEGRWVYEYTTKQNDVFFVLPQGQAIVYASEPVLVYERNGGTVVEIKRGNGDGKGQSRNIIFKTRAP